MTVYEKIIEKTGYESKAMKYKVTLKYVIKHGEEHLFHTCVNWGDTKQNALCNAYELLITESSKGLYYGK